MTNLWAKSAGVGFVCLMFLVSGPARGEFKLLEPYSETIVSGINKFVAKEAFKVGSKIGGRTLSAVGWSFAKHFLAVAETNVPEVDVTAWTLLYTAGDKSLIHASGGEEGVVHFLAHIHRLMDLSDKGPSHLDWRSNFAYMRSPVDGRLWAVHWTVNYTNEWNVGAVYVPHPDLDWRSGSRLFSSRSLPSCPGGAGTGSGCRDGIGSADNSAHMPWAAR